MREVLPTAESIREDRVERRKRKRERANNRRKREDLRMRIRQSV
jgi:hypothetical protein